MNTTTQTYNTSNRPVLIALIVGIVAAVIAVIGLFISGPALFFQAYLYAFLFYLSLSLGLLVLLLLHFSVGSRWGLAIRRIAEAASGSIWVLALLFIPILFGLPYLYPWADPAKVAADPLLQAKSWYLNVPFFIARAVFCFAVWIIMAFLANRHSARRTEEMADTTLAFPGRGGGLSGFGLVVFAFVMTLAAIDWIMTLQPAWISTAFGLVIIMGQVQAGLAFAVVMLNLLPSRSLGRAWTYLTTPIPFQDLGALMITFVMGWAYVAFFQMLIQWAGNITHEVIYYTIRSTGGWDVLEILIFLFEFALPFMILLSIRARHNLKVVGVLGGMLLIIYLINMFWHIKPVFSPGLFAISWIDIVMAFALGGIWLAVFLFTLRGRPPLNAADQAIVSRPAIEPEEV